jgi:HTH-type transcriptional regulator/antitoxin HigA
MQIKPIRNDDDLREAFQRLEVIFQAEAGTPEYDEMEILTTLIEVYENKYHPINAANPIEAIKFRMEQRSLTPKDLEAYIGSSGRVSEILSGKRSLSLRMIQKLHHGLKIPYESLLSGSEKPSPRSASVG